MVATTKDDDPGPATGRIKRIRVRQFRSIREAELSVGGVTALVGEASAGKSNLLAAIALGLGGAPGETAASHPGVVISIDAETSSGPVTIAYPADAAETPTGGWPVAMLPSSLRDGAILDPAFAHNPHSGIATLAAAIRQQSAHRTSPGARAEAFVAAIEVCCKGTVSGVMLLIEEPEQFLRPQAQRYLYRLLHQFAAAGNQVVYSTHAPAFVNVARLDEVAVIYRSPREGTQVHQAEPVPAGDEFRVMSEFDAERGELFLADVAVLVEGRTEKLALPHVFRALGVDIDRQGISIVECGGKSNLPLFVRLCQASGVPFLVLHDRDAEAQEEPIPSERRTNDTLRVLAGDAGVFELAPDFEAVAGLRDRQHKPEQAWRRFRGLPASAVPAELARLVTAAVALLANPVRGPRR